MEWTVSSILDYLAGDGYGCPPDESPDRPNTIHAESPEVPATESQEQPDTAHSGASESVDTRTAAERRGAHDIDSERGCRRMILDRWTDIEKLHGPSAKASQVRLVVKRNLSVKEEDLPVLKTFHNCLIELRKKGLIPG